MIARLRTRAFERGRPETLESLQRWPNNSMQNYLRLCWLVLVLEDRREEELINLSCIAMLLQCL
jgi:hypothetical protein